MRFENHKQKKCIHIKMIDLYIINIQIWWCFLSMKLDAWCAEMYKFCSVPECSTPFDPKTSSIFSPHPCLKLAGWLDTWGAEMWELCKCSSSGHRVQMWCMWVKLFLGTWKVGYMWVRDLYNGLVSWQMGCPAWQPAMTNMLKAGNPICVSPFI